MPSGCCLRWDECSQEYQSRWGRLAHDVADPTSSYCTVPVCHDTSRYCLFMMPLLPAREQLLRERIGRQAHDHGVHASTPLLLFDR